MGKVTVVGAKVEMKKPSAFDPILANNSPELIQKAVKSGKAANYWAVGDVVPITLNGTVGLRTFSNETFYAFIIGFNHNSGVEGNNTIHFQFGKTSDGVDIVFVDSNYGTQSSQNSIGRVNTGYNKYNGWSGCYMRNTTCPAFLSAMPVAWQNIITACTKYSDNKGDTSNTSNTASYVTATSDKIWALSEFEVMGSRRYANSAEQQYQKQYAYYSSGNSRIRYRENIPANKSEWWLRSTAVNDGNTVEYNDPYWCQINTSGNTSAWTPQSGGGFSPCFKVS